jgi:hypothetical protein
MLKEGICPVCYKAVPDEGADCWECGAPALLRKTPSRPGPITSDPAALPRERRKLTALVTPLLVLAAMLAFHGSWSAGRLTIQTEPPGAVVKVGTRTLGTTPLQVEGSAGSYWVSIRMQDFEPVELQVMIPKNGKALASIPLRPLMGRRRPLRRDPGDVSSLRIAETQVARQTQVIAARFGGTD